MVCERKKSLNQFSKPIFVCLFIDDELRGMYRLLYPDIYWNCWTLFSPEDNFGKSRKSIKNLLCSQRTYEGIVHKLRLVSGGAGRCLAFQTLQTNIFYFHGEKQAIPN